MNYTIHFEGKLKDAIGIYYPIRALRQSNSAAGAVLELYNQYDVITVYSVESIDTQSNINCDHLVGEVDNNGALETVSALEFSDRRLTLFYKYSYCPDCGTKL